MKLIDRIFKSKTNYTQTYKSISEAAYLESKIKRPRHTLFTKLFVYTVLYTYVLSIAFNILLIRENKFLESKLYTVKTTIETINRNNKNSKEFVELNIVVEKTKEGIKDIKIETKKEPK